MIRLNNVTKIYKPRDGNVVTAVRDLSLNITQGEFVVIVGRSGSGKTTVLNLAAGLTRPTSGNVAIDGVDLQHLPDQQLSTMRSQKIGFVFQFPSLLPTLTVIENIILPTIFTPNGNSTKAYMRAKELLSNVGLEGKIYAYPRQLSAGEQQRVVIARSLMNQPQILLADEPTSNLDEKTESDIMDLFSGLHGSMSLTIALVTHTRQLVSHGMRLVELAEGQIVQSPTIVAG